MDGAIFQSSFWGEWPMPGREDDGVDLIWREDDWCLQSTQKLCLEEALPAAGVYGNSPALQTVLSCLHRRAEDRDPAVFCGAAGVGKITFARLLHRLHSHNSCACQLVFCQNLLDDPSPQTSLQQWLRRLTTCARPSAILVHPEVLPTDLCGQILAALLGKEHPVRILLTVDGPVDGVAMDSVCRNLPDGMGSLLREWAIAVPSLDERRQDIRPTIFAKLRDLNRRTGLEKKIAEQALEELQRHGNYRQNFATLLRMVEDLHATHPAVICSAQKMGPAAGREGQKSSIAWGRNFHLPAFLGAVRRIIVHAALEKAANNQAQAARLLGVRPQAISKFLKAGKRIHGSCQIAATMVNALHDAL
jgi:hypothetical protein